MEVVGRLDGKTPVAKRQGMIDSFNRGSGARCFLLSSKAGGVGINLIGACKMVMFDCDWNPATDRQAMARCWRDGQKREVFVYRLIAGDTLEERIYQRQVAKEGLSGALIDFLGGADSFSKKDLKDLFTVKKEYDMREEGSSLTHDLLGCACQSGEGQGGGKKSELGALGEYKHAGSEEDCIEKLEEADLGRVWSDCAGGISFILAKN
jgi:DNA repair and recombination protein RAD54B